MLSEILSDSLAPQPDMELVGDSAADPLSSHPVGGGYERVSPPTCSRASVTLCPQCQLGSPRAEGENLWAIKAR